MRGVAREGFASLVVALPSLRFLIRSRQGGHDGSGSGVGHDREGSEYALTLPRNGWNLHNDHLSVVGLAATAAFYWPFVKTAMGKS